MISTAPRLGRLLQRLVLLTAVVLYISCAVADVHLHVDEHEGEECTFCAISETSHIPEIGSVNFQRTELRWFDSIPVISATLSPRLYEAGHPRAPPIS